MFLVSRLTPLKRADLLIQALATADGQGRPRVIAGDGEERPRSSSSLDGLGVGRSRARSPAASRDDELLDHLARCRAVCFPPFEEDYGFVTAEAFASRKAVITCRDSGGPAELVAGRRQRGSSASRRRSRWRAHCGALASDPAPWRSGWARQRSRRVRGSPGPIPSGS